MVVKVLFLPIFAFGKSKQNFHLRIRGSSRGLKGNEVWNSCGGKYMG